jgi:predicted ATPase
VAEQPSGTVTLVFSDIEGSTKLLESLGTSAYREALAEHRRIVREAYARYQGYEVDYEGDAFFYTFANAPEAVAAVSEAMKGLKAGPIKIRVGIHTGTPELDPPKYVGLDVHTAARIMSTGHGGQVVVSQTTAALVETPLQELGEHRLKDIQEPVPLYQLGEGSFPPLKTISNTNLPHPASSFVGREREVSEVAALLQDGARLITLSGPGGSGKTRLAIEAASELVPDYKAGVFWVGLAALRDPTLVTETIAQVLGAKDGLAEHIGERELLLLLDNLEQVIDAAPELGALLEACPNLTLLVTSRELLRVRGEVEYAVPPLAEPEAVSLFCERAQLETDETIAELCRRLDNLPLAVELAAARTSVLTPTQILERLSQRLDLLKGGRDSEARQQTLRATIEWSYELLSPEEQQLFGRLSVFAGGCTLEAAEEVAEADLDTLQSLVEKSLVRFTGGRYWMLETIREYAAERLQEAGESHDIARRHANHFASLVEEADPALRSGPDPEWLSRLDRDHENVRSALEWAHRVADTDAALRIVLAMQYFWWLRGQFREASGWHAVVLEHETDRTPARGKALIGAARFANTLEDLDRAEAWAREGLDLWREIGDIDWTIRSLNELGNTLGEKGVLEEAMKWYEDGLTLARAHGDAQWAIVLTENIGDVLLRESRYEEARVRFEQGLREARAIGYLGGKVMALTGLGDVELRVRHDEAASRAFASALRLIAEIGHRELASRCFRGMAVLAARRRDAARAARLAALADELDESLGASSLKPDIDSETEAFARDELGEDYASAYEEARGLDFESAVDYALSGVA